MNSTKKMQCWIIVGMLFMFVSIWNTEVSRAAEVQADTFSDLHRAKIYLASGDYRRAVEACQQHIEQTPSVESYVYLIYVYHALDGYVEWLAQQDNWGDVGRVAMSMVNRGTLDLVDPPDMLSRMAKEILKEGIRQQFWTTVLPWFPAHTIQFLLSESQRSKVLEVHLSRHFLRRVPSAP